MIKLLLIIFTVCLNSDITSASTVLVELHEKLILKCEHGRGDSPYNILWYLNGRSLAFHDGPDENGPKYFNDPCTRDNCDLSYPEAELTIESVGFNLEGRYDCMVDFYDMATYDAIVQVSPMTANMSGIDNDWVLEGETYPLVCEISEMKPEGNITWLVNGVEQETNTENSQNADGKTWHVIGTHNLNVNTRDDMDLGCKVNQTWHFNYKKVNVYYRPSTIVEAATPGLPAFEGQPYTVRCSIELAKPHIIEIYSWLMNGTELPDERSELLYIAKLSREGEVYTCAAQNLAGMGLYGTSLNIDVMYPFSVTAIGPAYPVVETDAALIRCEVQRAGNPDWLQDVTWQRHGMPIVIEDEDGVSGGTVAEPHLRFVSVKYTDFASYTCHLTNAVGVGSSAPVPLTVLYGPKICESQYKSKAAEVGQSVTLDACTFSAPPSQSYKWSFEGADDLRQGIAGANSSTIFISKVEHQDFGLYTCTITNSISSTSVSIQMVANVYPTNTGLIVGVVLGWTVAIAAGTVVVFLLWRSRQNNDSKPKAPPTPIQMNNLGKEETGQSDSTCQEDGDIDVCVTTSPDNACYDEVNTSVLETAYVNAAFDTMDLDLSLYSELDGKERENHQTYDNQPSIENLYDKLDVIPTLSADQEEQEEQEKPEEEEELDETECPYDEI